MKKSRVKLKHSNLIWKKENDKVVLFDNDEGIEIPIESQVIVKAQFKGLNQYNNLELPGQPSLSIDDIKFNRFPLTTSLKITVDNFNSRCRLELLLKDGSREIYLDDISLLDDQIDDQIIHDNRWYSIEKFSLEEVKTVLRNAGLHRLQDFNLGFYLKLAGEEGVLTNLVSGDLPERDSSIPEKSQFFNGKLYNYQERGLSWLRSVLENGIGGVLGDEMGLGKTCQVIASICEIKEREDGIFLIVAPSTLLENWRREFNKFAPQIRPLIHSGHDRTGFPSKLKNYDVIITSYDVAVSDLALFKMFSWTAVVLDEAQNIKNRDTRRARAVKDIPRKAGLAVTGTPVENSLQDLWSIMDFCVPGFLGSLEDFKLRFSDDFKSAQALEGIITPLILRRVVKDVASDLPDKIIVDQALDMSPREKSNYELVRQKALLEYGTSGGLVSLGFLRMFCTHPFLLEQGLSDPAAESEKYIRLLEVLEEVFARGEKVLIFSSFQGMASILKEDLGRRFSVPVQIIDGRTPIKERQPVVDCFQEERGSAVLVLNPRAAGAGLNITAANHVIHYNLEWNPAVEDQATARAYRRGQVLPVTIHRFYYINTVEEVINTRIERKRLLSEGAILGVDPDEENLQDINKAILASPMEVEF